MSDLANTHALLKFPPKPYRVDEGGNHDSNAEDRAECASAIDAATPEIRRLALEEAAKECDSEARGAKEMEFTQSWIEASERCAERIRALIEAEKGTP